MSASGSSGAPKPRRDVTQGSTPTLLTTVCNTLPAVVPYSLGLRIDGVDWFVDLADALNRQGDKGLTGAVWLDGEVLLAVQSAGSPRILVLDHRLRPVRELRHEGFVDLHSLHVAGDGLLVVSTGNGTVWRLAVGAGRAEMAFRAPGSMHLNAALPGPDGPLLCAHTLIPLSSFGRRGGLVTRAGVVVLDDLAHPHSPLRVGEHLYVLDSAGETLIERGPGGGRGLSLSGFLRGMAPWGDALLVAGGPGRLMSRKNPRPTTHRDLWNAFGGRNVIHVVDRESLTPGERWHPILAGFEIYELFVPPTGALDPDPNRLIRPDANQLARAYYEAAKRSGKL